MSNQKALRVVFMGTPEFAVATLNAIHASHHKVVAVVTAPDKPAGRGLKIHESAVKIAAVNAGIAVLQPEKLKAPDFIDELQSLQADVFVVVAFRMLPEVVWNMPELGSINLHASLLPAYRGAAPIQRAVMNGEKRTGLTVFKLQQEIDTGDVLGKLELEIGKNETAGELHDRMMVSGAQLLTSVLDILAEGKHHGIPQQQLMPSGNLPTAPKIFRDDCLLNWNLTAQEVHNQVRGLSPYPGAFTFLNGKSLKVLRGENLPELKIDADYEVIGSQLLFRCADGSYSVTQLQPEGKKVMSSEEFLRGWRG
jgi:methionyl-tRNA formyltransferase